MLIETHNRISDLPAREDDARLRALLIYEDVGAGKKGKATCDILAGKFGPQWKIGIEMFSFDSLGAQPLRQDAATALLRADLIILSSTNSDLPSAVLEWLELLLQPQGNPMALVFLAAMAEPTQPCWVEKYLSDIAQRRRIQFFSYVSQRTDDDEITHLMPDSQKESNDSDCAIEICAYRAGNL
jgi:hypothetical protein